MALAASNGLSAPSGLVLPLFEGLTTGGRRSHLRFVGCVPDDLDTPPECLTR